MFATNLRQTTGDKRGRVQLALSECNHAYQQAFLVFLGVEGELTKGGGAALDGADGDGA